jgi:broad specificity phosphatase PhoE
MRSLVHRRHGQRDPGQVHLSPKGVAQARTLGRSSGPFDRVVTSPRARAVETAREMGYEVDARLPDLATLPPPVARFLEQESPTTFREYAWWAVEVDEVRATAERLLAAWGRELDRVPDGGRLLLVSHTGLIELAAASALPDDAADWGPTLAPLEGVRLDRVRGRWVHGEVLRVDS